jgi:uncharacterized protein YndB with AHSA1/START domain
MIGRFVELDPPHRLQFTYGWKDDLMGVPPESTIVQIVLTATDAGTRLELTHLDLPPEHADEHRNGWDHFLTELATLLHTTTD